MKDFHFIHISLPVSPLSGIPPEQHRSGKCPTNPGTTPDNHGQPGGVRQVLPVPDWGIANTGF